MTQSTEEQIKVLREFSACRDFSLLGPNDYQRICRAFFVVQVLCDFVADQLAARADSEGETIPEAYTRDYGDGWNAAIYAAEKAIRDKYNGIDDDVFEDTSPDDLHELMCETILALRKGPHHG